MAKNESVSFEHGSKDGPPAEELERAGKAILVLIDRVAQTTEARVAETTKTAQKVTEQLRAAEDRIRQLETELRHYQQRAARAEEWLMRVRNEIQNNFFSQNAGPPD